MSKTDDPEDVSSHGSDAITMYTSIHTLATRLAKCTAYGPRSAPAPDEHIVALYDELSRHIEPMRSRAVPQNGLSLTDRVKPIYPVVHRAYDLFVGTQQGDEHVDVRKIRVRDGWFGEKEFRLRVDDNPFTKQKYPREYPDCGVGIILFYNSKFLYVITRFRPTWKREDPHYDKRYVVQRANGESVAPDDCIDIRSPYFKINCLPPEDFVRALVAGGSEPKLRCVTLDHLLSLPEILGPYLDRKERGELAPGR